MQYLKGKGERENISVQNTKKKRERECFYRETCLSARLGRDARREGVKYVAARYIDRGVLRKKVAAHFKRAVYEKRKV